MGISHSGDGFGFPWLGGKPHRPPGGPATLTVYNTNISSQEILLWPHKPPTEDDVLLDFERKF